MDDVEFLDAELVRELHAEALHRDGGAAGERDPNALEAAVAGPQWTARFDPAADLHDLAAVYAVRLARNHPFLDGNKRAALAAALVFLDLNGAAVTLPSDRLEPAMLDVATGALGEAALAAILRALPRLPPAG